MKILCTSLRGLTVAFVLAFIFSTQSALSSSSSQEQFEPKGLSEFGRDRRIPHMYPIQRYGPNYYPEYDNEAEDEEDPDEMVRGRRIPYYYPRYRNHPFKFFKRFMDYEDQDEKRTVKKRGNPYFYPNLKYNFLPEYKRFLPFKRTSKKSMVDTLSNDNVSAFGYDKRSPATPWHEEEDFYEDSPRHFRDEDDKKKRMAMG